MIQGQAMGPRSRHPGEQSILTPSTSGLRGEQTRDGAVGIAGGGMSEVEAEAAEAEGTTEIVFPLTEVEVEDTIHKGGQTAGSQEVQVITVRKEDMTTTARIIEASLKGLPPSALGRDRHILGVRGQVLWGLRLR